VSGWDEAVDASVWSTVIVVVEPAWQGIVKRGRGEYHSSMSLNDSAFEIEQGKRSDDLCNVPCFKEDLVERLRAAMPPDEQLEETRVMFAALADRTRLRIMHALKDGEELCVCDVAHVLDTSVSAASHHLRKLRDLRALKHRNDKKMAYYSLRDRFVAELAHQALREAARR
jgi:ArsR family transcriptional regulator, lead/cadmium/zinc/bismuth-responsive transcriptional repressor